MGEACGLCGSTRSAPWLDRGPWHYRGCADCSAVWLDPLPADDWTETFYDHRYFTGGRSGGYADYLGDESQHRANARARIALAKHFGAAPPGAWLDVGCAAGFTLDEARRAGFRVLGAEPSAWARATAHEQFSLDVYPTLADAQLACAGRLDVVSMFQVLEHMRDPVDALQSARAGLRPGGTLIVETWDRRSTVARLTGRHWHQISPPSVLWLLDRTSIAHVLERTGFDSPAFVPTAKRVSLGWGLGLLADKAPWLAPVHRALGHSRLRHLGVAYRMGDLISVVARAKE